MNINQYLWVLCALVLCFYAQAENEHNVELTWIGGPSLMIEFEGMKILTDPMLGEGDEAFQMADPNEMFDLERGPNVRFHKRLTPLPQVDLSSIDLVLLSHAHEDHFDQKAQQLLNKQLPVVLPIDDEKKVMQMGFKNLSPLAIGARRVYKAGKGEIRLFAVRADHTDNKALEPLLGHGLGYILEFEKHEDVIRMYWSGDSLPTPRVLKELKQYGDIDVLIPNMGRVGTTGPLGKISMGAEDVVFLAQVLNVEHVLPIHHSSYELYLEPISEFLKLSENKGWVLKLISEGEAAQY